MCRLLSPARGLGAWASIMWVVRFSLVTCTDCTDREVFHTKHIFSRTALSHFYDLPYFHCCMFQIAVVIMKLKNLKNDKITEAVTWPGRSEPSRNVRRLEVGSKVPLSCARLYSVIISQWTVRSSHRHTVRFTLHLHTAVYSRLRL